MGRTVDTGTGEALAGPGLRWPGAAGAYNRSNGKSHRAGRASDGAVLPLEGEGQHNPARGKGPCCITRLRRREGPVNA